MQQPSYSEASLIVTDFTLSVHGSSCNYLFFGLLVAPFAFSFYSPAYLRQKQIKSA